MKQKLRVSRITSFIIALCMLAVLAVTSMQMLCFGGTGWYKHEFNKYSVLEDVRGEMSMESSLSVTSEMLDFLRGRRDDIDLVTTIDGEEREFFSDKEKQHLTDCRQIFGTLFVMRWIALAVAAALIVLSVRRGRGLAKWYAIWTAGIAAAVGLVCAVVDFDTLFIRLHLALFDNQLWLLNPNEDNLINLLPYGFFNDTAMVIGVMTVALELLTVMVLRIIDRK